MSEPNQELKAIGKTLSELRAKEKLTLNALATSAGISENRLAKLESGDAEVTILELADLAKALGTNTEDLLKNAGM